MLPTFDWMLNLQPNLPLMSVPEWLDEEFLRKCLVAHLKDDQIVVDSFNIKAVANPGEQFSTSIYKVQVIYSGSNGQIVKHLFVKTTPPGGPKIEVLSDTLFIREAKMYVEVLPNIEVILKEVFGETRKCAPRWDLNTIYIHD